MKPYIFPSSIETARALILHLVKLMLDEREIAHLSEDGQYLCANEGVLQYDLPLNLFIGSSRKIPLVDVVVWAKKRIFPEIGWIAKRFWR